MVVTCQTSWVSTCCIKVLHNQFEANRKMESYSADIRSMVEAGYRHELVWQDKHHEVMQLIETWPGNGKQPPDFPFFKVALKTAKPVGLAQSCCIKVLHNQFEANRKMESYSADIRSMVEAGYRHELVWAVYNRWTGLTGLDYWTHPKFCEMPFPALFNVGQKLKILIHSLKLIARPVVASFVTFLE